MKVRNSRILNPILYNVWPHFFLNNKKTKKRRPPFVCFWPIRQHRWDFFLCLSNISHIVDNSILHALNCLSTRMNDGTKLTLGALYYVLIDDCYGNQNALNLYRTSEYDVMYQQQHSFFSRTKNKKKGRSILLLWIPMMEQKSKK